MSDLREKVARALCTDDGNSCGCATACKIGLAYADKAIALVLEEAAKVADEYDGDGILWDNAAVACYEIAAAIRALKEKSDE